MYLAMLLKCFKDLPCFLQTSCVYRCNSSCSSSSTDKCCNIQTCFDWYCFDNITDICKVHHSTQVKTPDNCNSSEKNCCTNTQANLSSKSPLSLLYCGIFSDRILFNAKSS